MLGRARRTGRHFLPAAALLLLTAGTAATAATAPSTTAISPVPNRLAYLKAGGAWVDGVALRAEDSRSAIHALAAAGAERTGSPVRWLTGHRRTSTDLGLVAAVEARESRRDRLRLVLVTLFPVLIVTSWWTRGSASHWGLLALGAGCAVVLTVPVWARRRNRA